jgi:hypothetical protein
MNPGAPTVKSFEKWITPLAVIVALLAQFGAVAGFATRLDARLAAVEQRLTDLAPAVDAAAAEAHDAAIRVTALRSEFDQLRGRVDAHDEALNAVARIDERLASQQRQLDRLEVLLERR